MKKFVCADMNRFNSLITQTDSIYREAAFKLGLTYSAMMVLYAVLNNGGSCPISDICAFGINKQTVNSALRKLETEDVVFLEAAGGRRKNVRLTENGMALAEKTILKIINIENEIFASWTKNERETYIELTKRYMNQLSEKVSKI
ncbi:MAG: MarR family transcriptional regulator [Oscillospiraceae bacterium]|jgi:DNA-binding MarR family transcriptional regulator|nr:MarR family transcriptional regulator [Oscillospiraceae bacterium]